MSKFSNIEKILARLNAEDGEQYDVLVERRLMGFRARIVLSKDVRIPLFAGEHDATGDLPQLAGVGPSMVEALDSLNDMCFEKEEVC